MQRKETYATTGPRMTVRFFGGWDFNKEDTLSRLPASVGYTKGVPMGGDLPAASGQKSSQLFGGGDEGSLHGNLDRIQIVKGWIDKNDKTNEKVFDVGWSGDRKAGPNGKLPPVGNTVDVKNATWENSIGSPELIGTWTDPDFDPGSRHFTTLASSKFLHHAGRPRGKAFRNHHVGRRSDDDRSAPIPRRYGTRRKLRQKKP